MAARPATDAELIALVPDVSVVDSAIRVEYLAFAEDMIDLDLFGDRFSRAHIFLTAHFLALTQSNVSAKSPATNKKIGQISAGFAVGTPAGDEELSSTAYGLLFLAQSKRVWAPPIVGGP